ncbi:hypothetical protein WDU94_013032 [Cyamophila willieti]
MYDQVFCSQLIRFHQKLIQFQEMFQKFYSPVMFAKILMSNTILTLILYQVTTTDFNSVAKARVYKALVEFIGVIYVYYYLCHCSETLDDAQRRVTVAVASSYWFKCSNTTRRQVCMLLRRTQIPNHFKFYQGLIILSRAFFYSVAQVSYSYVNYMKLVG